MNNRANRPICLPKALRQVMTSFSADSYSEADLEAEFDRLFPQGFAGPDVLQELAPGGWQNSPLLAVFHPSLAQTSSRVIAIG